MTKNQGSRNFKSKLVEAEVVEILNSKLSQREIAERFHISQSLVSRIRNRKLWRHVILAAEETKTSSDT